MFGVILYHLFQLKVIVSVSGSGASLLDVIKRLMNLHQVIGLISAAMMHCFGGGESVFKTR